MEATEFQLKMGLTQIILQLLSKLFKNKYSSNEK